MMTPGTVTQTVWSLTEDSGDRVVQDQAGLRLRRGRDTIPIVNVTTHGRHEPRPNTQVCAVFALAESLQQSS